MTSFHFEQIFRTPRSEQWSVRSGNPDDTTPYGRVDVHFESPASRITVVLRDDLADDAVEELLGLVDEQLIPGHARADVRITLWRGEHAGTFIPD